MLKILLVEDSSEKARCILDVLASCQGINKESIVVVDDIVKAKRNLENTYFDLMLLDIRIPERFPNKPLKNGGAKLLKELVVENYISPFHIIGITAYDDEDGDVDLVFEDSLWAIVKYDISTDRWKELIARKVEYLVQSKRSLALPSNKEYDYDLGIVCALDKVELESVKGLSETWHEIRVPCDEGTIYYETEFQRDGKTLRVIAAASSQMGMSAAAILTTKMIYNFSPRFIGMPGIAAGIKGDVQIGDILVADQSWDYGNGKFVENGDNLKFRPDPKQLPLSQALKANFQQFASKNDIFDRIRQSWPAEKPTNTFTVRIGPVGSGAAVVSAEDMINGIKEHQRKLIGVEMEIYGVYLAAASGPKPRPEVFAMKAVCDFADANKNDNHQYYAGFVSAQALYEFALMYL